MKKILSAMLMMIGIGIFICGNHIAKVAADGEAKVVQVQKNESESSRPIVGPIRGGVKIQVTDATDQKIGQAEQKIVQSRVTANWLHGTGVALFLIGMSCLIRSYSNKK